MKLSVIIPVYNAEKYLEKCVDSVLMQSYNNFEVILINDGSTDSSGVICDSYALNDSRVKVFHQSNKGVSAARNLGIHKSKGEWLYFMDSDDTINENLFAILEKNDAYIDVIQFGFNRISLDEKTLSFFPKSNKIYNSADDYIKDVSYKTFTLWVHFFRSSIIEKYNIRFTEGQKYAEDLEFTIKVYACSSGITTNKYIGYNYLVHEESTMARAYTLENAELHLTVANQLAYFCEFNNLKIDDFIISRVEYMIKSFFSFSLKADVNKKCISAILKRFVLKNESIVVKDVLSTGTLIIAKYNPIIYLRMMKLKSVFKK